MEENKADFVVVGLSTLLQTPVGRRKAKKGTPEEITKCIRCGTCISAGFIPHVPFSSGVLRYVNPTWAESMKIPEKKNLFCVQRRYWWQAEARGMEVLHNSGTPRTSGDSV